MAVTAAHRHYWQQRLQAEDAAIAERRQWAEQQATRSAEALRAQWPQIQAIWLFGSVLEPSFSLQSDLDLCVEGLPNAALLDAMALLDHVGLPGQPQEQRLPVDLVRFEALPPHWQQRLRERARLLL
ncbi:nucleotidyltransferase domain-containing protein [Vulcanococcus sp.]|jgi:predicted nucleotidyltransferase|uniref:nucleotidyltransferase domain-containing protein n=1 Tax=Vulcanococcus sp. TaxID=2856995 RepID=UPI003C081047